MLFIMAIIAMLIEAYLRREAIRGSSEAHHKLIRGSSQAHQKLISANHPKWKRT